MKSLTQKNVDPNACLILEGNEQPCATKLAFRKHEVEISETIDELYIYEINVLRNEINNLLSKYDRNNQTS